MAPFMKAAILLFLASACATQTPPPGGCSFAGEDLERVINNDLLTKLPPVHLSTKRFHGRSGDLIIADRKIESMDSLRLFGPLLTYCRNGTRVVQFDLTNERPLSIAVTLGSEDKLVTTAKLLRLTVQCEVEGSGQGIRLRRKAEVPVALALSSLETFERRFQEGPSDFWYNDFFVELETLLKQLLP
ncbi:uncharacterized protein LOC144152027 [Haemaphysalis longicornis]